MRLSNIVLVIAVIVVANSIKRYLNEDPTVVYPIAWKLLSHLDNKNAESSFAMQLSDALSSRFEEFISPSVFGNSKESHAAVTSFLGDLLSKLLYIYRS